MHAGEPLATAVCHGTYSRWRSAGPLRGLPG